METSKSMEVQFQNTHADFKLYYDMVWRHGKDGKRREYYFSSGWYLAVLFLAAFIAAKSGEIFGAAVFVTFVIFFLVQNGSFAKRWDSQLNAAADLNNETSNRLIIDERGISEFFAGVEQIVSWAAITGYTIERDMLFIHFLKERAIIIPLRNLSENQRAELLGIMESHGVKVRNKEKLL